MGAEVNPAQRLHALGQSLWLDSINRVMLRTGALARYVRELAVTGLTSNPTILGHAMAAGSDYDSSLARLAGEGVTDAQDLVYALALEELDAAASLFRAEWERTGGTDGYLAVPSVASVFISRWDSAADPLLPPALHGVLGLAMAQKTYSSHLQLLSDKRWQALAEAGARPQRVLWASTSTKNPDFPDTYYLGRLAAPNTIDTVPEKTLIAFADHGAPDERLEPDYAAAERTVSAVAGAGIDVDALAERLQRQGAGAFSADWASLLTAIEEKAQKLKPEASQ